MEKTALAEWLAGHPAVIALAFAFVAGYGAYTAFYSGMEFGRLRAELSDLTRAASEALGG